MKSFLAPLVGVMVILLSSFSPFIDKANAATFGNFEVPIPALKGKTIDDVVSQPKPILFYVGILINIITAVIVMIGLISIVIGAYFYMTAGGEAKRVDMGKDFIKAAISGIVLALTAWLILNTISPQFASNIQEPCIATKDKPCP
jgi:hypothetical protein